MKTIASVLLVVSTCLVGGCSSGVDPKNGGDEDAGGVASDTSDDPGERKCLTALPEFESPVGFVTAPQSGTAEITEVTAEGLTMRGEEDTEEIRFMTPGLDLTGDFAVGDMVSLHDSVYVDGNYADGTQAVASSETLVEFGINQGRELATPPHVSLDQHAINGFYEDVIDEDICEDYSACDGLNSSLTVYSMSLRDTETRETWIAEPGVVTELGARRAYVHASDSASFSNIDPDTCQGTHPRRMRLAVTIVGPPPS